MIKIREKKISYNFSSFCLVQAFYNKKIMNNRKQGKTVLLGNIHTNETIATRMEPTNI